MAPSARIYVAGHRGLVGSALVNRLQSDGYDNLILHSRHEYDLTDRAAVQKLFSQEEPEYVFVAAAKVGGILANNTYPADFIRDNLAIALNVIDQSYRSGVRRLLFLGSSCIYPKLAPQPLKEEFLLSGPLEFTNRAYAVAKIAGIEICWSYNRQYGVRFLAVMPTNLYGPGDNYDLQNSHVLPALIRKMHEGKASGAPSVVVWGTGSPRREFLYSADLADACVFLMNLAEPQFDLLLNDLARGPLINIGCGRDLTIAELARTVAKVVGFTGEIVFDTSKADGPPRKLLDVSRMAELGWAPSVALEQGIATAYQDYLLQRKSD
jgi:GDP-L-fucose synthase